MPEQSTDRAKSAKKTSSWQNIKAGMENYFEPKNFKKSFLDKMRKRQSKVEAKEAKEQEKAQKKAQEAQNP